MKQIFLGLVAAALTLTHVYAAEADWLTSVPKALEKAKAEKKFVLLDFTGSDWCGPCIKLHKDVFSSKEFADYAAKDFVLVKLDYPARTPQPAEEKKANEKLKGKYNIEGFPTLIVLDSEGKELGRQVGYGGDGPKATIAAIEKLKTK
jgi:protein disulfide-isomerase